MEPTPLLHEHLNTLSAELAAAAARVKDAHAAHCQAKGEAFRAEERAAQLGVELSHLQAATGQAEGETSLIRTARVAVVMTFGSDDEKAAWLRGSGWKRLQSGWQRGEGGGLHAFDAALKTQARIDAAPLKHLITTKGPTPS